MNIFLYRNLTQEAVMGDTVTGQDIVDMPDDIEDAVGRVASDVSMGEVEHEIVKATQDMDELDRVGSSLESISLSIESSNSDIADYRSIHFAAKILTGDVFNIPHVSLERFTTDPQLTMESLADEIGDIVTKIWDAIKAYFKKISEFILEFFSNYFSNLEKLERYLKRTKTRLAKVKRGDGVPNKPAIKLMYASKLQIDGELDVKVLRRGTDILLKTLLQSAYERNIETIKMGYDGIYSWFEKRDNGEISQLYNIVKRFNGDMLDIYNNQLDRKDSLPGCKRVTLIQDASRSKLSLPTYLTIYNSDKCQEYRGDGTMETPSLDILSLLVETIDASLFIVSNHKDDIKEIRKLRDDVKNRADGWIGNAQGGLVKGVLDKAEIRQVLRIATNNSIRGLVDVNKYLYDYSTACLDLVDKGLSAYE